jgi:hypothetical protein
VAFEMPQAYAEHFRCVLPAHGQRLQGWARVVSIRRGCSIDSAHRASIHPL